MSDCNDNQKTGKLVTPQRNRYFYGKLLDEASLGMEQSYFNQKRWMMNRMGLGCGVMCGLKVVIQDDLICITPGVAIDFLGREIVVPEGKLINPRKITNDRGIPTGEELQAGEEGYVCLAYCECLAEEVLVLVTDCDSTDAKAPSVIRESYYVLVKKGIPPPLPEIPDPAICAALNEQDPEEKRKKLYEALSSRPCSAGDVCACVVLVSIMRDGDNTLVIPWNGRSQVYSNPELFEMLMCLSKGVGGTPGPVGPAGPIGTVGPEGPQGPPGKGLDDTLTKIIAINWPHDGELKAADLISLEALKVTFSREVIQRPVHDQSWFKVTVEMSCEDRLGNKEVNSQIVPVLIEAIYKRRPNLSNDLKPVFYELLVNDYQFSMATFWKFLTSLVEHCNIKQGSISLSGTECRWEHSSLLETISFLFPLVSLLYKINNLKVLIRVIVKCDYLIDSNGKSVDGNHLGGSLTNNNPTGDGIAGGEFESWFELTELDSVIIPIPGPRINNGLFKEFGLNPEEIISKFSNRTNQPEKGAMNGFFNNLKSLFKTGG